MSTNIPRKPVGSTKPTVIAPPVAHVQSPIRDHSDNDLSKDIEKGAYARRVSTEFDETTLPQRPPPYKRSIAGLGIFAKVKDAVAKPSSSGYGQKKYLGLTKRRLLICAVALIIVILALAIGLGVGLSKGKKAQNLPLPNNKEVHTGDLTYFSPALGACGITNSDSDSIVAVSHLIFDAVQTGSDPNQNPLCGKKIRASRFNEKAGEQRSVDLTVTDRCVGCAATDIDTTTSVFDQLADRDNGRVLTTWAWLDVDL